jgi:hypothetical protein
MERAGNEYVADRFNWAMVLQSVYLYIHSNNPHSTVLGILDILLGGAIEMTFPLVNVV